MAHPRHSKEGQPQVVSGERDPTEKEGPGVPRELTGHQGPGESRCGAAWPGIPQREWKRLLIILQTLEQRGAPVPASPGNPHAPWELQSPCGLEGGQSPWCRPWPRHGSPGGNPLSCLLSTLQVPTSSQEISLRLHYPESAPQPGGDHTLSDREVLTTLS